MNPNPCQHIKNISDTFGDEKTIQQLDKINRQFRLGVDTMNNGQAGDMSIFERVLSDTYINILLPLLLRRSVLCRDMNDLEEASKSAQQAVSIDFFNIDCHIAAVQAFVAQNKLTDALKQCEKALWAASLRHERRKELELLQEQLYEQANEGNKWPFDDAIIERIIHNLYFSDRLCLAATCRHWRNLIYNHSATWEDIAIITKQPYDNPLVPYITAHKIRHLAICTDNGLPPAVFYHWNQLESLEIVMGKTVKGKTGRDTRVSKYLARSLVVRNSANLKQLEVEINVVDLEPCDIFNDILTICPNLKRLKIHKHPQPFPKPVDSWLIAPMHPIPLTQLIFVNSELAWLKHLIPKCPQLQHIACVPKSSRYDDHQVLELAIKHCPRLQSFRVGEMEHIHAFPDNSLVYKRETTGIIDWTIINVSTVDNAASRFLEKNHLTLEGLSLPMESLDPFYKTLTTLGLVNVPRLRKIDLNKTTGLTTQRLSSPDLIVIIQNCSALETLWIANAAVVDDNVLFSLQHLQRLKDLEMTADISSRSGLHSFFSSAPCLKNVHVVLREPTFIASCLLCIAQSTTLINLKLSSLYFMSLSGLEEFATSLRAPLQTLKIQSTRGSVVKEDDDLTPLTRMPHLRHVELSSCLPSLRDKLRALSMNNTRIQIDIDILPAFQFGTSHKKSDALRIQRGEVQQL